MKKTLLLVAGIIICLAFVAGMYFWATSMMNTVYAYRSPLAENPPQPGAALGTPATRRVVIVLVDGLRLDTSLKQDVMPTLYQLRQQGASAEVHSRPPSYSEPAYSTIMTGAWQEINDGPVFNQDYADIKPITQDMIFTAAHRAGLKTAVSGYYWFEKLIPAGILNDSFFTPGEDRKADVDVVNAALPWLEKGDDQLILIHIDQVDYAGHHEGGGVSKAWDEASARSDALIAEILSKLDLQKDTILIFSDHGHINAGGHGGTEKVVLTQPFIMAGAGVTPGKYGNIYQVDIAPTIAALLGTNLPASAQGQVRTEIITLPDQTLANLPAAMKAQQEQLVKSYSAAIGVPIPANELDSKISVAGYQALMTSLRAKRVIQDRWPRAILSTVILAVLAYLLIRFWKKGMLWKILGALVFLAIFNLVFGLILGKSYSFSIITGAMGFILLVIEVSLMGFLAAWLFVAFTTRQFRLRPMDSALQTLVFVFTTIGVLLIPIAIHFTLNGALLSWTMPNWYILFFGLLFMIQILAVGVLGILFTGISALVSAFTSYKK
jgi:hypothetical protein